MEIGKVSDTRWSCQAKQFDAVWKRINIVYEVLQDVIDNDSNTNRTTEATGYLLQIDRRFIRYLLITKHILKKAKFASDILQKPTNDLSGAIDLIGTLKDEIGACTSRELCQKFGDEAEEVDNRLNLPDSARPVRRKRMSAALHDNLIEGNVEELTGVGFDGYFSDVFEIISKVSLELKKRFSEKNIVMIRGITTLCPTLSSFMDENSLILFAKLFKSDTSVLKFEFDTFKHLIERKADQEKANNLLELQAYLQKLKEAFFELHRIVIIACALPLSIAECERNFSSMRLIKNDLRSVIKQDRLDSLLMLGIHRDRGSKLDLDTIISRFKAKFPKCRILL
ncbi:Zinc finger MYM-type protein 1-like [Oopsacas minuta]|uniref:Zinc finger MYM-type protein 1-like n=1 Tax=Oopsacas minuta TaxID=111878 RepID=A0AAV7KIL1_9METZ|nr:Zinc finger MYM-type protein 1-like [Oopsacas minuta]